MSPDVQDQLRRLPAVGKLLGLPVVRQWLERHPESVVSGALRAALDQHRAWIQAGHATTPSLDDSVLEMARGIINEDARPSLRRVINATGIVLHTGLGRAPLSSAAVQALSVATGYCNLELDLQTGERGQRLDHVRGLLCRLSGAEAATVVNNNAAATLLVLKAVAEVHKPRSTDQRPRKRYRNRNVIVSRGQLIEIGGSYRLPEIMKAGGVALKEVGTTNRTRITDYEQAIDDRTAALMRVHTSNYRVTGFHEEVPVAELVALGQRYGLPVIDDLGSGALVELAELGLTDEPCVSASVSAGADLVCFSGDKLLGGPQAGIILGRAALVQAIERSPLMRTYRLDKLVLLALEATLRAYLDERRARRDIPVLAMLWQDLPAVEARARRLAHMLKEEASAARCEVREDVCYAGGGALPAEQLKSYAVRWRPSSLTADKAAAGLRRGEPAIVARVHKDALLFDCRTLADDDLETVARAVAALDGPPHTT